MLPLVVLGIFQMKSKEPVGFWSGVKPPTGDKVSDVAAYNKKHGIMWIVYGAGIVPAFFLGMVFDFNFPIENFSIDSQIV